MSLYPPQKKKKYTTIIILSATFNIQVIDNTKALLILIINFIEWEYHRKTDHYTLWWVKIYLTKKKSYIIENQTTNICYCHVWGFIYKYMIYIGHVYIKFSLSWKKILPCRRDARGITKLSLIQPIVIDNRIACLE